MASRLLPSSLIRLDGKRSGLADGFTEGGEKGAASLANPDMRPAFRFRCLRPRGLSPHARRCRPSQLAERLALAGDSLIELLVIVPFGPEQPIQHARPQAVVAGISGVVQRMVSGAGQHLAQPTVIIFRFQLEVRVAE